MAAQAQSKHLRLTPRKARLVADLIRGKNTSEASAILKYTAHKSAKVFQKVLKSAIANATQAGRVNVDRLFIQKVAVDCGPILKRFTTRAQGRGARVNKRTSHITVVLGER